MSGITEYMTRDHRHCDEIFALAEQAVDQQHWGQAGTEFDAFFNAVEKHLLMEELILFPAFEQHTGVLDGPTMVMREEHQQIRDMLEQLKSAIESADRESYLEIAETLLILMQQHNMKEEGILYPMTDQHLGAESAQLIADMEHSVA